MAEQDNEPAITLTNKELADFITALRQELVANITENNAQAMVSLFETVIPPFMERLEQIALGQVTLARALKTNRRDANATRFAEALLERAINANSLDEAALRLIPAQAYALADEMDVFGRVAEIQAEAKEKRMDEAMVGVSKFASPKELVDSFFGRQPDVAVPKVQTKNDGKKKH